MRVRIIKDHKQYKKGEIIDETPNVAFGLIDSGFAVVSKDMTETDSKQKDGRHGRPSTTSPNNPR